VADVNSEFSQALSETTNLVDATGHRLGQAAQRGVSETTDRAEEMGRRLTEAAQRGVSEATDRAEATGRRLNQTAEGMFDDALRTYQTFFSFQGAKQIAEVFIEFNERMAKDSLESNRRLIELWFNGVRKLWHMAEESRREVTSGA
jgi:SpoU rRNA methylase family enzyme